jgi:hypothetical protein
MRWWFALVLVPVLFSGSWAERIGPASLDHHEQTEHSHNDQDDHHSSPDSPCDHDFFHCCCAHSHALGLSGGGLLLGNGIAALLSPLEATTHLEPSVHLILHVPLA